MTADDKAYAIYLGLFLVGIIGFGLWSRPISLGETAKQSLIWVLIFLGVILLYSFKEPILSTLNPSVASQRGDTLVFRKKNDGHFHALAKINGTNIDFLVDTGASNIVLSQEDARRAGIDLTDLAYLNRAYTANGVVNSAVVNIDEISLGDIIHTNIKASVTNGEMNVSLLGMAYLSRFGEITIRGDELILRR